MKSSEITIGDILVFEKNSHGSSHGVMALDNKLWTMGLEWRDAEVPNGPRIQVNAFGPSTPGRKAGSTGSYGTGYREHGIPVLKVEHGHYNWTSDAHDKVVTPVEEILRTAAKQLGNVESAEDIPSQLPKGTREGWRTEVVALNEEGKKVSISVVLEVVRPQTLKGAWSTFLRNDELSRENQRKYREERAAKESAQREAGIVLAARLDALLGEKNRHWGASVDRSDCYRDGSAFKVDEKTLLALLELAEKGAAL